MQPRIHQPPDPTRLIRLLRVYTKRLGDFRGLLEADDVRERERPGSSATVATAGIKTPSPFRKKQKRVATRTYTRGSRRRQEEEVAVEVPLQREIEEAIRKRDVFRVDTERGGHTSSSSHSRQPTEATKLSDPAFFPISYGNIPPRQAQDAAKILISSLRNICQVISLQPGTSASHSAASSLMDMCSSVIGRHLERWLKSEVEEDCEGEEGWSEDDDEIGRLREWLDHVPRASLSQIFFEHCVSLALLLPAHSARAEVLWPMLQLCSQLDQVYAAQRIVPALFEAIPLDPSVDWHASAFRSIAPLARSLPPPFHLAVINAVAACLDHYPQRAISSLTDWASISGKGNGYHALVLLVRVWGILIKSGDQHTGASVLAAQAQELLQIVVNSSDSAEWTATGSLLRNELDRLCAEARSGLSCKAVQPTVYLAMVVIVGLAPLHLADRIAELLAGVTADPGIPFRLIPLHHLKQIATRLHTAGCFLVESWLLTHGTQAGLLDLEDSNIEAQRCYVQALQEAQSGSGTPGAQRKGWKWDDVILAWVEEQQTPARASQRLAEPLRAQVQDTEGIQSVLSRRISDRATGSLVKHGRHLSPPPQPSPDRLALRPVQMQTSSTPLADETASRVGFGSKRSWSDRDLELGKPSSTARPRVGEADELALTPQPRRSNHKPSVAAQQSPDMLSLTPLPLKRVLGQARQQTSASPLRRLLDRSKRSHRLAAQPPLFTDTRQVPTSPLLSAPESDDPLADMSGGCSPERISRYARIVQGSSRLRPFDSLLSDHHGSRVSSDRSYR